MTPRYKAGDIVASTNSGKLYCVHAVRPALDDAYYPVYEVRGVRNGRGYGHFSHMAENSLRDPSDRALELHREACARNPL